MAWAWAWTWVSACVWAWSPWAGASLAIVSSEQWWHQRHFARRGSPCFPASPFVGSMGELTSRRISSPEFTLKSYAARGVAGPEAPSVGFFEFRRPIAVVRDAASSRDVCVKRFDHFRNHRPSPAQADDLFSRSLFALRDRRWKDSRAAMSPAFTASKMRALFELISQCGHQSARFLEQRCKESPEEANGVYELEFKDFFTRFANDVIATSAFGVECDSFGQPNNEFYQMGKTITNFSGLRGLVALLFQLAPKLAVSSRSSFSGAKADAFFRSSIRDALTQREERGIYRPDVSQLMMEARDGRLGPHSPDGQPRATMTDEDIMGQAVLFFFAGFETVSSLMCFACHSSASHPEVQERSQREIDAAVDASGGEVDYDAVGRMKYLDMVLSETSRSYPPAPAIDRECAEDVESASGDGREPVRSRKGDVSWSPIMGVQRDPRYWPRPDAFDPERFSDANKHCIHPFTYMPFGSGPRICLAQRFASSEAKVASVHVSRRVRSVPVRRTNVPMRSATTGFNTASADGFWLGAALRR